MTRTQELRTLITARKEGDCGRGTYGWIFPKNLLAEFDFLSVFTSVSSPLLLLLFNSKRSLRSIFVESCSIERFHSRGQRLCKFILTKESVYIRKEFNSHRTGLGHQHGHRFIVLRHRYGRRDVMWKHSICTLPPLPCKSKRVCLTQATYFPTTTPNFRQKVLVLILSNLLPHLRYVKLL